MNNYLLSEEQFNTIRSALGQAIDIVAQELESAVITGDPDVDDWPNQLQDTLNQLNEAWRALRRAQ